MTKVPTLEQIKADLNKIIDLTKDLHTYKDIVKFEAAYKHKIEWIEINGEVTKNFDANTPIEWVRIDYFGCLNYIYIFLKDRRIMFDVFYGEDYAGYLAQDICPDDLTEENYNKWIVNLTEN